MNRFLNELNERAKGDPNSVEAHGPKMSPPKKPTKSKIRERVKATRTIATEGCGGGGFGCSITGNIYDPKPAKPLTGAQRKKNAERLAANKARQEKEKSHDKRKMVKKVATPKRKKTITKSDRKYGGR
jgi:hypothetical protein